MRRHTFVLALMVALSAAPLFAADDDKREAIKKEEKKKKEPTRIFPRGPELDELKTEAGLSDEQIAKAREAVATVTKKNEQLRGADAVKAAEEELKKAREAERAAEAKLKAAKEGFDLNDEFKLAVYNSVPEDKKAKVAEVLKLKIKKPAKEEKKE